MHGRCVRRGRGRVLSPARVVAGVAACDPREREERGEVRRGYGRREARVQRLAVFQPRDLNRQVAGTDHARDARSAAGDHVRRERERLHDRRHCNDE